METSLWAENWSVSLKSRQMYMQMYLISKWPIHQSINKLVGTSWVQLWRYIRPSDQLIIQLCPNKIIHLNSKIYPYITNEELHEDLMIKYDSEEITILMNIWWSNRIVRRLQYSQHNTKRIRLSPQIGSHTSFRQRSRTQSVESF